MIPGDALPARPLLEVHLHASGAASHLSSLLCQQYLLCNDSVHLIVDCSLSLKLISLQRQNHITETM